MADAAGQDFLIAISFDETVGGPHPFLQKQCNASCNNSGGKKNLCFSGMRR